ncbi:MAG: hypothetical protein QG650_68 [Patescibacteria group bacterium]|nr:hypothetical protein [Patescibacteria group bacterium]
MKFDKSTPAACGGERVDTASVPSEKRGKTAPAVSERVKNSLESLFSEQIRPETYADALLSQCASADEESRNREVAAAIRRLFVLGRTANALENPAMAAFFQNAKRIFVTKILTNVLRKFENEEGYREETGKAWSDWIFARSVEDVADFPFWNGWNDAFALRNDTPSKKRPI